MVQETPFASVSALVIDDDPSTRQIVARILKRSGFVGVTEAADGTEGLKALAQYLPDIVICDIQMRPMNGLQFLRQVREGSVKQNVPVLFLTGFAEPQFVKEAQTLKASDFIVKPISPRILIERVERALQL
jgi:two-component system, chemotaxis family, chemotaxis protein CheY